MAVPDNPLEIIRSLEAKHNLCMEKAQEYHQVLMGFLLGGAGTLIQPERLNEKSAKSTCDSLNTGITKEASERAPKRARLRKKRK